MSLARSRTSSADRRSAVVALGAGLAAAALVVAGVPATAGAAETPAPLVGAQGVGTVAGEYLVVLEPGVSTAAATRSVRRAEAGAGTVQRRFTHAVNGYSAKLSADDLAEVRQDPSVAYVEAVRRSAADHPATHQKLRATSAPRTAAAPQTVQSSPSWNLDRIDQRPPTLDKRYTYGPTGRGVTAYMVGDGRDKLGYHPGYLDRLILGVNVSGDRGDLRTCSGIGVAAADLAGGTEYGVAKKLKLSTVKITRCRDGVSDTAGFIAAMDWIIAHHQAGEPAVADIGDWYQASPAVDAAVTALIADGVTAVAVSGQPAAGAASQSACDFSPGRVPGVITVGAVNAAGQRDPRYSHSGKCVDLWAPGVNVEALYDGEFLGVWELYIWWGTWFAGPHVTGTVANYLELNPTATPAQVAAAIHAATTRGVLTGIGASAPNELVYALPADAPAKTSDAHAITSGTALGTGDAITSPNGFYTLRTQTDGTVVLTRAVGRVTWAPGVRASWLQMRPDGNLVGYDFGKSVWTTQTGGNGASDLRVQDDGNVVIYRRSDNTATWASRTAGKLPPKQPTAGADRLPAKQGLVRGGGVHLQSPNGRYRAFVHTDTGQLAVRDQTTGTYVFRTPVADSDWVGLQSDGNLVLVTRTGTPLWASGTGGKGLSDLVMQDDGNLVVYLRSTGKATWSSKGGKV